MKFSTQKDLPAKTDLIVLASFNKKSGKTSQYVPSSWSKEFKSHFEKSAFAADFKGEIGSSVIVDHDGQKVLVLGLGDKSKVKSENLRKETAKAWEALRKYETVSIDTESFNTLRGVDNTAEVMAEAIGLTNYQFDRYLSKKNTAKTKLICFLTKDKAQATKVKKALTKSESVISSVNIVRDFVNEPPNILNSESYAKMVEKDVKTNLKGSGVRVKILEKADLKKEKMGLFLSVNQASAFGPRLVHLTYTPKKVTKNTKHIALVGKGLTFDTGGASLKPGASMMNMKTDMGGSATVYGAFRLAVLLGANCKITCILGMTDNAIGPKASLPDSIVKGRNGITVEILNTDAEGRLVLADCLDYASDLKPNTIIDAATLTGAILISLGQEVAGVFSNNDKLASDLVKSANESDEYMWHMPIIPEYGDDMKAPLADLKNIGGSRFAGSGKAASFLQNFVQEGIDWAHLDVAGIVDSQAHLPYCDKKGASGLVVRSLAQYLLKN